MAESERDRSESIARSISLKTDVTILPCEDGILIKRGDRSLPVRGAGAIKLARWLMNNLDGRADIQDAIERYPKIQPVLADLLRRLLDVGFARSLPRDEVYEISRSERYSRISGYLHDHAAEPLKAVKRLDRFTVGVVGSGVCLRNLIGALFEYGVVRFKVVAPEGDRERLSQLFATCRRQRPDTRFSSRFMRVVLPITLSGSMQKGTVWLVADDRRFALGVLPLESNGHRGICGWVQRWRGGIAVVVPPSGRQIPLHTVRSLVRERATAFPTSAPAPAAAAIAAQHVVFEMLCRWALDDRAVVLKTVNVCEGTLVGRRMPLTPHGRWSSSGSVVSSGQMSHGAAVETFDLSNAVSFMQKLHGSPEAFGLTSVPTWRNTSFFPPLGNRVLNLPSPCENGWSESQAIPYLARLATYLWACYGCVSARLSPSQVLAQRSNGRAAAVLGVFPHRALASGGASYPADIYVQFGTAWDRVVPGISGNLFQYSPNYHCLSARSGDSGWRADLQCIESHSVRIYLCVNFARTSPKYGSFAYRLTAVDVGVVLGRLVSVAAVVGQPVLLDVDVPDADVDRRLGLDSSTQATYALLDFPAFLESNRAAVSEGALRESVSSLNCDAVVPMQLPQELQRMHAFVHGMRLPNERPKKMRRLEGITSHDERSTTVRMADLIHVIRRRHSSAGNFIGRSAPLSVLMDCLSASSDGMAALERSNAQGMSLPSMGVYCMALNVEGCEQGAYRFDPGTREITLISKGDLAEKIAACLHLSSAHVGFSSFIVHITGHVEWNRTERDARAYRVQQMVTGAAVDAIAIAATRAGASAHPYLGFKTEAVGRFYGLVVAAEIVTAQVCVSVPRNSNRITTSVVF